MKFNPHFLSMKISEWNSPFIFIIIIIVITCWSLYLIDILETLVWPPLSWLLRTFSSLGKLLCGFLCLYFEKCDQGNLNISFCCTKHEMKLELILGSRPLTSFFWEHSISKYCHCHFFSLTSFTTQESFFKALGAICFFLSLKVTY